jgi:hypothetical protein
MRSNRMIWSLGVLLLILVLSACGGQAPVTESIPEPEALEPTDPGHPSPTPVEVAETVATPSTNTPDAEREEQGLLLTPPTPPQPLTTSVPDSALSGVPQELLEIVLADLARRLDVKPDEIAVAKVESVTWSDTSLDCPQPGTMYAQVLTPGYRIVLKAGGEVYEYRTAREQYVILCGDDGPTGLPLFPLDPNEIKDGKPWMPVDGEEP